ncbi:MAG: TlpA disulfide reductase family protein [Pseudomonadota bacterium]
MALQHFFLGFALTLLALAAQASAPSIELRDFDNTPRNVNEFIGQGQWTIVAVWAHDCPICDKELPQMSAFHAAHRDRGGAVLGVTIDGLAQVDEARTFAARHRLPFVNLIAEPDPELLAKFGGGTFVGTPTHFFFDPLGRIVGRKVGPLPKEDLEAFIDVFNKSPYARH